MGSEAQRVEGRTGCREDLGGGDIGVYGNGDDRVWGGGISL